MGEKMTEKLVATLAGLADRIANSQVVAGVVNRVRSEERGDVPGWVLVAVMTAGLVTAIWMVADTQLTNILTRAIESVSK